MRFDMDQSDAGQASPSTQDSILGHRIYGSGPDTVVVLHEWLADHTNYEPMLPYLDPDRFTFVFADLRGYGLSRGHTGTFTAAEARGDVCHLMDRLGHERFHIVGHSMSGMVAQRIALDCPERIGSMVLISPVPASGFRVGADALAGMSAIAEDDAAAMAAFRVRTAARYGTTWLKRKLAILRAAVSPAALQGYLRMFTETDFSAEVTGLATPVLALVGEHDLPIYRANAVREALSGFKPSAIVRSSREAGHYMMLETPVFTASEIENFLSGQHA
jgi:pimeloyl-ACP methyl ester carboxylesterase